MINEPVIILSVPPHIGHRIEGGGTTPDSTPGFKFVYFLIISESSFGFTLANTSPCHCNAAEAECGSTSCTWPHKTSIHALSFLAGGKPYKIGKIWVVVPAGSVMGSHFIIKLVRSGNQLLAFSLSPMPQCHKSNLDHYNSINWTRLTQFIHATQCNSYACSYIHMSECINILRCPCFFFFITSVYVQNRSPILTQCNHLFFCSCAKTYHSNKRTFSCFVFICRARAETGDIVTMNFGFQEMAILNINFASAHTDTYITVTITLDTGRLCTNS